jgi:hypothetical protein
MWDLKSLSIYTMFSRKKVNFFNLEQKTFWLKYLNLKK